MIVRRVLRITLSSPARMLWLRGRIILVTKIDPPTEGRSSSSRPSYEKLSEENHTQLQKHTKSLILLPQPSRSRSRSHSTPPISLSPSIPHSLSTSFAIFSQRPPHYPLHSSLFPHQPDHRQTSLWIRYHDCCLIHVRVSRGGLFCWPVTKRLVNDG